MIVVIATDAPLLPHQLKRLAKRPAHAMGRLGDTGRETSGDIFIAFSTANSQIVSEQKDKMSLDAYPNGMLNPIFEGAVQAVEELVLNALVAAKTMTGRDGHRVYGLPHDEVRALLKKHGVLVAVTTELAKSLRSRHVAMISIGGIIGAGLVRRQQLGDRGHRTGRGRELPARRPRGAGGHAHAERDGRSDAGPRLVHRIHPPRARRLGRLRQRLALLVLLGASWSRSKRSPARSLLHQWIDLPVWQIGLALMLAAHGGEPDVVALVRRVRVLVLVDQGRRDRRLHLHRRRVRARAHVAERVRRSAI